MNDTTDLCAPRSLDPKPAPVVVFKGDPDQGDYTSFNRPDFRPPHEGFGSPVGVRRGEPPPVRDSRTLTWDRNPKPDRSDPKYFPVNSLPRQRAPGNALSPPREGWRGGGGGGGDYRDSYHGPVRGSRGVGGGGGGGEVYTPNARDMPPPMHALPSYQPPPPVVTEQPRTLKEPTHFKPYKHAYNGLQGKAGEGGGGVEDLYSPAYSLDNNPRPDSALGNNKPAFWNKAVTILINVYIHINILCII